ncbi:MAG: immune inhibitor A [Chloroflexi bacterium]|nr:immune inhibitor A [Chloroflexota bacterium]
MGRATGGRRIVALLLFWVAVLAACGGGGQGQTTPTATTASPTPTFTATPTPSGTPQQSTAPPNRDLLDLARRFRGLPADAPRLARQTPYAQQVGDSQQFTVLDLDAPATLTISATLRFITEHAYFFVQDGLPQSSSDLEAFANDFETIVYPAVTAAFGREWSPGVDSDPRIAILHAKLIGAGGYFNMADQFPVAVAPTSNQREMFYLDAGFLGSSKLAYDAVAGHELQHLVHWSADPDEDAWVNEGLSQVAAELIGASTAGLRAFLSEPDTQLTDWPAEGNTSAHYAGSELFFRYLLDRFGGTQKAADLLRIQEDGIAGVDVYLKPFGTTFLDVFPDWLAANYLDEESGPYSHQDIDARVSDVTKVDQLGDGQDTVHQFGADYLEVQPPAGTFATLDFDGSDEVSVGVPPRDGPFWWSNRGDSIDSRLTREFDLRGLQRASLRFWTWFQIELGYDYAYVAGSTDGGQTWRALAGRQTTDYDPVGQSYGPGYTGDSGGEAPAWVQEEVDLTPFAGQRVLLRFEYVTDDSANLNGFAVDDIEVPELAFRDGADSDGGWTAEGFRRVQGPLPQQFLLLIIDKSQTPARVERVPLSDGNRTQVLLGDNPATIVVAAITQGTTEVASYRWSLSAR